MKMRKVIPIVFAIGSIGILTAMVQGPSSSGAPPSHTGAPDEQTCAASGCHDDNPVNAGRAKLSVNAGNIMNYSPGKTYPVTVRIEDSAIVRFGFQVVALSLDNKVIGKMKLTDPRRTQLSTNESTFREYITYTFDGTDATATGIGEWTFNWKAPSTNSGPVSFYVSAVSANDNENDKGDFVYTGKLIINDSK